MSKRMPRAALLVQPGVGELQAELRFADAGRADHGGERARQQPAAQQVVKSVDAGGKAWSVGHSRWRGLEISGRLASLIPLQRRDNRGGLLRLMGLGVDAKRGIETLFVILALGLEPRQNVRIDVDGDGHRLTRAHVASPSQRKPSTAAECPTCRSPHRP